MAYKGSTYTSKQFALVEKEILLAINERRFPEGIFSSDLIKAFELPVSPHLTAKVAKKLCKEGKLFRATVGIRSSRKLFTSEQQRDDHDMYSVPGKQAVKHTSSNPRNLPDGLRLWMVDLQCLGNLEPTYRHGYGLSR